MRIAILGSYAPSLINFRGPLLQHLIKLGHEVYALAPDISDEVANKLEGLGAVPTEVPLERNGLDPLQDLRSIRALTTTLGDIQPDIFFSYTVKPVVYGTIAASLARVPKIVVMVTGLGHAFIESEDHNPFVSTVVRSLYAFSLRFADRVIFHNADDRAEFLASNLVPDDGRAVVVDGSGVDVEHFAYSPAPVKPIRFLLITRIIREKGVLEFVEASRRLKKHFPDVEIRLVGPTDSNPSSLSKIQVLEWVGEETLSWPGRVSDVREEIERCSVYVLPSYREGMPRTNLEAMAIGRPLVTTDVPGCRETVDGSNGRLVPARDSDALYEAMRWFVEHPDRISEMGRASRRLVESRFTLPHILKDMARHITGDEAK
jgi:glycosyltransferase involved in cell wall biosynthesis